jgi:hypothetical protein
MNKYFKTTGIFLGIWVIASFLNGLLSGTAIAVFDSGSVNAGMGTLAISIILSFIFSAPIVGLVWFIAIMAQLAEKKGDSLFQFILGTAFICAIAAALIFMYTLGTEVMNARYVAGLCIIVSAMVAVLLFRKQIKTNE